MSQKASSHRFVPHYTSIRAIGIRTKTKYIDKPTEYKDFSPYWQKRLIENSPTHFYKHNQHGQKSAIFKIIEIKIVDSPQKYLDEGVLHTKKAILMVGAPID